MFSIHTPLLFLMLGGVALAVTSYPNQMHYRFIWRPTAYLLGKTSEKGDGFDGEYRINYDMYPLGFYFRFYREHFFQESRVLTSETGAIPKDSLKLLRSHDMYTMYCHNKVLLHEVRMCYWMNLTTLVTNCKDPSTCYFTSCVPTECQEPSTCDDNIIIPNNLEQRIDCTAGYGRCKLDDYVKEWIKAAQFDNSRQWATIDKIDKIETQLATILGRFGNFTGPRTVDDLMNQVDRFDAVNGKILANIDNLTDLRKELEGKMRKIDAFLANMTDYRKEPELGLQKIASLTAARDEAQIERKRTSNESNLSIYVFIVLCAIIIAVVVALPVRRLCDKIRYSACNQSPV